MTGDRINVPRLRRFVTDFADLLSEAPTETRILDEGGGLLKSLVAHDDFLPDAFAEPVKPYGQYLLHCDSAERFSVVSFVWPPGRHTPIHNHTVWGLIGLLRGEETEQPYTWTADGLDPGVPVTLRPGDVAAVSPRIGDIHRVSNALADQVSLSIHVYGGNIGSVERAAFNAAGAPSRFVSGYSSPVLPNLWDRDLRAHPSRTDANGMTAP